MVNLASFSYIAATRMRGIVRIFRNVPTVLTSGLAYQREGESWDMGFARVHIASYIPSPYFPCSDFQSRVTESQNEKNRDLVQGYGMHIRDEVNSNY